MKPLFVMLLLATGLCSQPVQPINWTYDIEGATFDVSRGPGPTCAAVIYAKIATGISAKTYAPDPNVPGQWCYFVTAWVHGVESMPSNIVQRTIRPPAPVIVGLLLKNVCVINGTGFHKSHADPPRFDAGGYLLNPVKMVANEPGGNCLYAGTRP